MYHARAIWRFTAEAVGTKIFYVNTKAAAPSASSTIRQGSPTWTRDLADFLIRLVHTDQYGLYHASNTGSCTWFQFAQAIFELSGLNVEVLPCTTEEFPRPAPRPAYSVLGHDAMIRAGFTPLRHWREALRAFLSQK